MKKDLKPTKLLVEATDGDPTWLGGVLRSMQVPVDSKGSYRTSDLRRAFERASAAASKDPATQSIPSEVLKTLVTIADMGPNENSMRDWLRGLFKQHELEVVGRGERDGALFTLQRSDELQIRVFTHGAASVRENGLISFSVSFLDEAELPWHAFVCRPWAKVFLRHRKEILKGMRPDRKHSDRAFVSFSPGTNKNLFEFRVAELKSGPGWKKLI